MNVLKITQKMLGWILLFLAIWVTYIAFTSNTLVNVPVIFGAMIVTLALYLLTEIWQIKRRL